MRKVTPKRIRMMAQLMVRQNRWIEEDLRPLGYRGKPMPTEDAEQKLLGWGWSHEQITELKQQVNANP